MREERVVMNGNDVQRTILEEMKRNNDEMQEYRQKILLFGNRMKRNVRG